MSHNNNGSNSSDTVNRPYNTGSFTSKVQNALSEIAQLKAKYNIRPSSTASTSLRSSSLSSSSSSSSPSSAPAAAVSNRMNQTTTDRQAIGSSPAAGEAVSSRRGNGNDGGQLHDTLHDALAEIARIQSKYNVASSSVPTTSRTQAHAQPQAQPQRYRNHTAAARSDSNAAATKSAAAAREKAPTIPSQNQQESRNRPDYDESRSSGTVANGNHRGKNGSSLSERLSALTMADLEPSTSIRDRAQNSVDNSREMTRIMEDLESERSKRRKLENLLRRSANEIRTLQDQLASLTANDEVFSRAMQVAGAWDARGLLAWVEKTAQSQAEHIRDEAQRVTLEKRCAHLEDVVQQKNKRISDHRAEVIELRREAAEAKMKAAITANGHSKRSHGGLRDVPTEAVAGPLDQYHEYEETDLPPRGAFSQRGRTAYLPSQSSAAFSLPKQQQQQQQQQQQKQQQQQQRIQQSEPEPVFAKFEDYRQQQHRHPADQATTLQSHRLSSQPQAGANVRTRSRSPPNRQRQMLSRSQPTPVDNRYPTTFDTEHEDRSDADDVDQDSAYGNDAGAYAQIYNSIPSRRRQSYSSSPISRDREQRKQQHARVRRQQDEHRNPTSQNMLESSAGGKKRGTGRSRSQPPPQQRAIASRTRRKTKKLQGNMFRENGASDIAARPSSSGHGAHRRSRSLGGAGRGPTSSRPFETRIHELSRQLSHDDWEQRRNALTELQDIVKNTGEAGSLAAAGVGAWTDRILTDLGARIAVVLKELRSAIMKEACIVIVIFGDVLGPHAASLGAAVMPVLLNLTHCGNTTMQRYAKDCLDLAAETIPCPALLAEASTLLLEDSSKVRRAAAGDSIRLALRFWPLSLIDSPNSRKLIVQGLEQGLQDKANETRVACRAAYVEALEVCPEVAHAIFDRLSKFERSKLLKYTAGAGSPSGSSTGASPRSR